MLIVVTLLGVSQSRAQDSPPAAKASQAALDRQISGLEETLNIAAAHTSAGRFAEGQQVLETVLETAPPPEAQHALRLALADLHAACGRAS
jgi:hypothetical protein